jgi:hypothetical protein
MGKILGDLERTYRRLFLQVKTTSQKKPSKICKGRRTYCAFILLELGTAPCIEWAVGQKLEGAIEAHLNPHEGIVILERRPRKENLGWGNDCPSSLLSYELPRAW